MIRDGSNLPKQLEMIAIEGVALENSGKGTVHPAIQFELTFRDNKRNVIPGSETFVLALEGTDIIGLATQIISAAVEAEVLAHRARTGEELDSFDIGRDDS